MFTGINDGKWEYANVYEWDGELWVKLDRKQNAWKVMEGISDLTRGAPDGVFADVFCKVLWAQQAFINELQTKIITLMEGGTIQSDSKTDNVPDVLIKANGEALFNNATIRGTFIVGGTWDKDGKIVNERARGSLLALNKEFSGNKTELRAKNMALYGDTVLGLSVDDSGDGYTMFFGTRYLPAGNGNLLLASSLRYISGTYKAPELFNRIDHFLIEIPNSLTEIYLVNGTIIYYSNGYKPVFVTGVRKLLISGKITYVLYGSYDGLINTGVTSSEINVRRSNGTILATVSGNSDIIANFTFL